MSIESPFLWLRTFISVSSNSKRAKRATGSEIPITFCSWRATLFGEIPSRSANCAWVSLSRCRISRNSFPFILQIYTLSNNLIQGLSTSLLVHVPHEVPHFLLVLSPQTPAVFLPDSYRESFLRPDLTGVRGESHSSLFRVVHAPSTHLSPQFRYSPSRF